MGKLGDRVQVGRTLRVNIQVEGVLSINIRSKVGREKS